MKINTITLVIFNSFHRFSHWVGRRGFMVIVNYDNGNVGDAAVAIVSEVNEAMQKGFTVPLGWTQDHSASFAVIETHIHQDHWQHMLSIHAKCLAEVGDLALTHLQAWQELLDTNERANERCKFLSPSKWVLDFVPVGRAFWNKGDYTRGDSQNKNLDLYRPLFKPSNYNNSLVMPVIPTKAKVGLYLLPGGKVILHHAYTKPKAVIALSIAASWRIRVPVTKPLTDHFPDPDIWPKKDLRPKTTLGASTKDAKKRKRATTNEYARVPPPEGTKPKYKSKGEAAAMFNKPHLQTSKDGDCTSDEQHLCDSDRRDAADAYEQSLEDGEASIEGDQDLGMTELKDTTC